MNIFKHTRDFIGDFTDETNTLTVMEVLLAAHKIRIKLGKKGYLLDTYLSLFFASINHTSAYDSADLGFQLSSDLRGLCFSVIDKKDTYKEHPLYEKAVDILASNPSFLEFQERYTQCNLLFLSLADDFIATLVGEVALDNLNLLLKQKFMVCSVLSTFIQGFTNELLDVILSTDIETNQKIFQLGFDKLFHTSETN